MVSVLSFDPTLGCDHDALTVFRFPDVDALITWEKIGPV
jgi:hypothetical protein